MWGGLFGDAAVEGVDEAGDVEFHVGEGGFAVVGGFVPCGVVFRLWWLLSHFPLLGGRGFGYCKQ